MLATKRPRRAVSTEDSLDPRVMTERQQLAFLLRATAPSDASESSSSSSSSDFSSEDEDEDEAPRRPRAVKRGKTRTNCTLLSVWIAVLLLFAGVLTAFACNLWKC